MLGKSHITDSKAIDCKVVMIASRDVAVVGHERWQVFEDETGRERTFKKREDIRDEKSSACSVRHALPKSKP